MSRLQAHQHPHLEGISALPQSHPGLCGAPVGPGNERTPTVHVKASVFFDVSVRSRHFVNVDVFLLP